MSCAKEWDGDCVLGHCGSPSGCERDGACRADCGTSSPPDGGPAFPTNNGADRYNAPGMTLRDYFAAKAMQGFAADPTTSGDVRVIAAVAYEWADAMLKARSA